jgi:hypothetical protein
MHTSDGGIVATAYAPCTVNTEIASRSVRIDLQTDYPFDEALKFKVEAEGPLRFPLYLRIPAWTDGATVKVGNEDSIPVREGTFHRIEREWSRSTVVSLHLPMRVRVERRYHNGISIGRGPLVYSLKIGEDWRLIRGNPPHGDWEVYPTTAWNYGLDIKADDPDESISFEKRSVGDRPFSPDGAPVMARVMGRRLPGWTIEHNAAGPLPESPVSSQEPLEELILIPYGCTNLRVTELPVLG